MKNNLIGKIAIVVVILAAFIGYNIYAQWDETHFSVNPEAFTIKDSYEEVYQAQTKMYRYLELARKISLPKPLDESVVLPDQHRKITVHEIWFRYPGIYLLYSINLHKEDQDEESVPKLQFSSMKVQIQDEKSIHVNLKTIRRPPGLNDHSYVFNGRLYRGILLYPDFANAEYNVINSFQDIHNKFQKIILQKPELIINEKEKIKINGLQLAYDYNREDYKLVDVPLNEKISLDTGVTIRFTNFQSWIRYNQLQFTVAPEEKHVESLFFQSDQPGYKLEMSGRYGAFVEQKEDGVYSVRIPPFSEIPESLILKLTDVGLTGKKSTMAIPAKLEADKKKTGEILGTSFYFEGYREQENSIDGQGETVSLRLKWETPLPRRMQKGDQLLGFYPRPYLWYERNLQHAGNEKEKQRMQRNAKNLIAIVNEKGERPGFILTKNANGDDEYSTVDLVLRKSYVQNSEHLTLHFSRLAYRHSIEPKTIRLKFQDAE
ncbi:MAG TPA: hypothetical protein VFT51_11330 [Bacillales bacterium]|nr:hypothetical protein [Bacillales bacterium]